MATLVEEHQSINLRINKLKTNVWARLDSDGMHPALAGATISTERIIVSGEPVGTTFFEIQKSMEVVEGCANRFKSLSSLGHSQSELLLLRSTACSAVVHILRTVPPDHVKPAVVRAQQLLDEALAHIVGHELTDIQKLQASLPIGQTGLGLTQFDTITEVAFLASVVEASQCLHALRLADEEAFPHWIIKENKALDTKHKPTPGATN